MAGIGRFTNCVKLAFHAIDDEAKRENSNVVVANIAVIHHVILYLSRICLNKKPQPKKKVPIISR